MSRLTRKLAARWRDAAVQLAYLPKTWRLIWVASHPWTIAWVILLVMQGVLPAATVYLTRSVVDSLVTIVGAGLSWVTLQTLVWPVGWMAGVLLLTELLQGIGEWVRTAQAELVQDYISALVHRQSIAIDFACYESSAYNDQLTRAREGASSRSLALLENTGSLLQNGITLVAMAVILLPYGVWLPIVLVGSALPAFLVTLRFNLQQFQWSQQTTTDRRRLQYYEVLLTDNWVAAELRLFNFGSYYQRAYQALRQRLRQEQLQLVRQQSLNRLGAGLLALVIGGGALLWMGWQVVLGVMTLGDLALFYQAFNRGQGIVQALLGNVGQIYKNLLFISNLFDFLTLKPQIVDPPHPIAMPPQIRQGIRFRQVSFCYPGSSTPVLTNFNLTIPAGQVVAIVGDNGAGKSTLIKLLCRLYDPTAGQIEIDGIDIRHFALSDLRRTITVLFQDPMSYYDTAAQNIAISDLGTIASPAEIEAAAKDAGIHEQILRLPHGYDSMLGKWFPDGTDLSGGEWQRLGLARAFLRKAPLIVLDEPTSAMDPWAEFDWLERFRYMAQGRTAIVITHRFTLAMRADMIHVMRHGCILESGRHDQLIQQEGLYAQSWQTQMQANGKY